jgi:hypothetical protein
LGIAPVGTSSVIVPLLFSITLPTRTRVSKLPINGATRSDAAPVMRARTSVPTGAVAGVIGWYE